MSQQVGQRLHVSPEVLRETKLQMENYILEANAIVNGYLNTHQDAMTTIWDGPAGMASMTTAQRLHEQLFQTTDGLNGMAHGLGQAADLLEAQEDEQARAMPQA